jgi:hypothetical protein
LVQLVGIAEALEIPVRTLLQRAERRVRWRGTGGASAQPRGNGAKKDKKGKRRG